MIKFPSSRETAREYQNRVIRHDDGTTNETRNLPDMIYMQTQLRFRYMFPSNIAHA